MPVLSNTSDIPLPLAVWLAYNEYDFKPTSKSISATSLLKPTKQLVLAPRVPLAERKHDVSDFINSRMGTAFHDSIEKAWNQNYEGSLKLLGYPQKTIDRIVINPPEDIDTTKYIPVYMEKRSEREIDGFKISGKFDMTIEGNLFDFKSTSAFKWLFGSGDEDYILQGSIYRWLNPTIITGDTITINFIFTDWKKSEAKRNQNYPQSRLASKTYNLLSLEETESFIRSKIRDLVKQIDLPEEEIPECTDEELWRTEPSYKYYANPNNTGGRATRVFDDYHQAMAHKAEKGKGIVLTIPGQVKACPYCPAFPICKQKERYLDDFK